MHVHVNLQLHKDILHISKLYLSRCLSLGLHTLFMFCNDIKNNNNHVR